MKSLYIKKYFRTLFLASVFLFIFVPIALCAEYWGSMNSNKFHYPACTHAHRIKPENLIKFNSRKAAKQAGYIPCKVCRP